MSRILSILSYFLFFVLLLVLAMGFGLFDSFVEVDTVTDSDSYRKKSQVVEVPPPAPVAPKSKPPDQPIKAVIKLLDPPPAEMVVKLESREINFPLEPVLGQKMVGSATKHRQRPPPPPSPQPPVVIVEPPLPPRRISPRPAVKPIVPAVTTICHVVYSDAQEQIIVTNSGARGPDRAVMLYDQVHDWTWSEENQMWKTSLCLPESTLAQWGGKYARSGISLCVREAGIGIYCRSLRKIKLLSFTCEAGEYFIYRPRRR